MTATIALLPDLSSPSLVPLGMAYGGVIGYWLARVSKRPRESIAAATADGAAWLGTATLVVYLLRLLGLL